MGGRSGRRVALAPAEHEGFEEAGEPGGQKARPQVPMETLRPTPPRNGQSRQIPLGHTIVHHDRRPYWAATSLAPLNAQSTWFVQSTGRVRGCKGCRTSVRRFRWSARGVSYTRRRPSGSTARTPVGRRAGCSRRPPSRPHAGDQSGDEDQDDYGARPPRRDMPLLLPGLRIKASDPHGFAFQVICGIVSAMAEAVSRWSHHALQKENRSFSRGFGTE